MEPVIFFRRVLNLGSWLCYLKRISLVKERYHAKMVTEIVTNQLHLSFYTLSLRAFHWEDACWNRNRLELTLPRNQVMEVSIWVTTITFLKGFKPNNRNSVGSGQNTDSSVELASSLRETWWCLPNIELLINTLKEIPKPDKGQFSP